MKYNIAFIIKDADFAKDDIPKAIQYLSEETPLDFSYDIIEKPDIRVSHTIFQKSEFDGKYWLGTYKTKEQLRPFIEENTYHAVCFIYDRTKSVFHNLSNFQIASWSIWKPLYIRTEYTEVAMDADADSRDWTWKIIAHELVHSFVKRANRHGRGIKDELDSTLVNGKKTHYYMNHDPRHEDGNFARTFKNLEGHWDMVSYFPELAKYRYFTASEVKGLQPHFAQMLDDARHEAGVPFIITSGYRTQSHNDEVGGIENSAHTKGLAVDLSCTDSKARWKIVDSLIHIGFSRIGIYNRHIHVDLDSTKPKHVMWVG